MNLIVVVLACISVLQGLVSAEPGLQIEVVQKVGGMCGCGCQGECHEDTHSGGSDDNGQDDGDNSGQGPIITTEEPIITTQIITTTTEEPLQCNSPYVYIPGVPVCIVVGSSSEASFQLHQGSCPSGGKLLESLQTQEQLDALKGFAGGYNYWIGITNGVWVSGAPVAGSLWAPGEPDGDPNSCGFICLACDPPSLADLPCSETLYFICQNP